MGRATNSVKKVTIIVVTAYVFISEFYWLIKVLPHLLGADGLALMTPFIFRGTLFAALVLSLVGRLAEHFELYMHSGTVADDLKFHFLRHALEFILLIYIVIKILVVILN